MKKILILLFFIINSDHVYSNAFKSCLEKCNKQDKILLRRILLGSIRTNELEENIEKIKSSLHHKSEDIKTRHEKKLKHLKKMIKVIQENQEKEKGKLSLESQQALQFIMNSIKKISSTDSIKQYKNIKHRYSEFINQFNKNFTKKN